ncbi:MAG: helix-turn-helix transcriptional regulator [Planctomycetota bacterium]
MQYSFRLAELLGHVPDPIKRPGTIKSIVEYTGLDRHQVAALLKNEVKYIPLKALSRLCDYLIEHGHATADQLPGALFAVEPENFWELLARRSRLEMCVGVRKDVSAESSDVSFVVASDSVLLGEILNGVTTLGGTAKLRKGENGEFSPIIRPAESAPHPEHLKQSLVWSPGQAEASEVARRAWMVYNEFSESKGDKALVGIGSTKSNPVVEIVLARAFNCEPFVSQDVSGSSQERSIPFFMRYRDHDPHPPSCVAGLQLSQEKKELYPGLYYEAANGDWTRFGSDKPNEEVAFVFYVHRESQGRLEMVLGGFSGRATRLLARALATRAEDFWPPVYEMQGIQVGGFLAKFNLPSSKKEKDILRTDLVATTEVTKIPVESFERRLGKIKK